MAPEVLGLRGLIEGWAREPETDAAEKGGHSPEAGGNSRDDRQ